MDSSLTCPSPDSTDATPPNSRFHRPRRWLAAVGVLGTALLLTGCKVPGFGEYPGSTTQGRTEYHLWQGFFIAGLVVGGLVLLLILWAVFRYRRKDESIPKQTQYHTLIEIFYTVVPVVIVVILFVFTVFAENKVDATPSNPQAAVTVKAFQWGWEFEYPGGVKVIGQTTQAPTMVIPAGTDVQINLSSLDVLHGFYVPQFNFSRYASPGYTTHFDFNVLHPGIYRGQCTQLCGLYHSLMFFNVKAVSPSAYAKWLRVQQAEVKANPSSAPKLPSGVNDSNSSNSSGSNLGGDLYGD
ncbi:MAG TPA: cytochrome c oxidase subunit II [Acidimicrobiales bacterium]|nr:cytochrome c oxidase subunit II [Acidimicrobiales bacterium]